MKSATQIGKTQSITINSIVIHRVFYDNNWLNCSSMIYVFNITGRHQSEIGKTMIGARLRMIIWGTLATGDLDGKLPESKTTLTAVGT